LRVLGEDLSGYGERDRGGVSGLLERERGKLEWGRRREKKKSAVLADFNVAWSCHKVRGHRATMLPCAANLECSTTML